MTTTPELGSNVRRAIDAAERGHWMSEHIDRHLERHLGPIERGWAPLDGPAGVQVCLFTNQPVTDVVSYSTLGLSRHVLAMPRGREVRQELLLAVGSRFADEDLSKLLMHVADSIVGEHRALLRGEVVPLGHPILRGSRCSNLYVSLPVVFPEGLATCEETQPATVFAWLVPISDTEATVVRERGWEHFEDALEREDLDLFDLDRDLLISSDERSRVPPRS